MEVEFRRLNLARSNFKNISVDDELNWINRYTTQINK